MCVCARVCVCVCVCVPVPELLYAVQWCKEMEYSPGLVSDYHTLLTDWSLPQATACLTPASELLDTLYSRYTHTHSALHLLGAPENRCCCLCWVYLSGCLDAVLSVNSLLPPAVSLSLWSLQVSGGGRPVVSDPTGLHAQNYRHGRRQSQRRCCQEAVRRPGQVRKREFMK